MGAQLPGPVGTENYSQAMADPRYQQLNQERMDPLRAQGLGYPVQFAPAQDPAALPQAGGGGQAGGGKAGGGGGEKKKDPPVSLVAHRLRGSR